MSKTLYEHVPHVHYPRNVNQIQGIEHRMGGWNIKIAVWLTKATGTMQCAYIFALLAFIGLFGLLGWLNPFTFLLATWISQQFLQLIFLPILSVGQSVLNRHQELQANETYATTIKTYSDIEQIMLHLDAQDAALVQMQAQIEQLLKGGKL